MLRAKSTTIKRQNGDEIVIDGVSTFKEALEENRMDNDAIDAAGVSGTDNLRGVNLSHGSAYGADFSGSDMGKNGQRSANLSYLRATGALFNRTDLTGASLAFADMDGADLRGCDMTDCLFSNGRIVGAALDGATLNWTQHRFIYEILRRTLKMDGMTYAASEKRKVEVTAMFLAQDAGDVRDFGEILAALPAKERAWVVKECKPFVVEGDNAPAALRGR